MGSEQGMGWNWIVSLATYCELYIITEGEYREQIEKWMADPSNSMKSSHLHFYYLPIGGQDQKKCEKIRKMCWNQGNWLFYYYYEKWQKRALTFAQEIIEKHHIDLIHQLNMIGFREPGYLWKIGQIPFVWGPIGGLKQFPLHYLENADLKKMLFMGVKNCLNTLQIKYDRRVDKALNKASLLISSIPDSYWAIKKYKKLDSVIIPETGCLDFDSCVLPRNANPIFTLLWVGKFDFRKQLPLALQVLSRLKDLPVQLKVFGDGNEQQVRYVKELAMSLNIEEQVVWMGNRPNHEVHEAMSASDLFLFTSVSEDTSTVVLEAISHCLPVVCFDCCGMSAVIDDSVGRKIPLTNPNQSVMDFEAAIRTLYSDKRLIGTLRQNCVTKRHELSWENKAQKVVGLYSTVLKKSNNRI